MKTRWLKTIIVATVFAVIFVPVAINYLCLTVFPAPLVGDGKLWLGFWGSYLGGIIAVLSTVYVLYRNHEMEYNRKEYEIQKEYFDSLCVDMGKLCSTIDIDILCFYLMNLKKTEDAINTMQEIGKLEKNINFVYNEFCLKHAHYRGDEGENLLSTYSSYAKLISHHIGIIQETIVNRHIGIINVSDYNAAIKRACNELQKIGDIRMELLCLADKWKKREYAITEEKRHRYKNG